MKKTLSFAHRITSISAYLLIMSFFTSTVAVELFGDHHTTLVVKTYISYAIWAVVPLMAAVGITGSKMAPNVKKGPLAAKEKAYAFRCDERHLDFGSGGDLFAAFSRK